MAWDAGSGRDSLYTLLTKTAASTMKATSSTSNPNAHAHRRAHFTSVRLKQTSSSSRSAALFDGSHPSGARSGHSSTNVPANHNSGNTREQMRLR